VILRDCISRKIKSFFPDSCDVDTTFVLSYFSFSSTLQELLILDEADRLLELGFAERYCIL